MAFAEHVGEVAGQQPGELSQVGIHNDARLPGELGGGEVARI
jgi:hypothetical protein